MSVKSIAFLTVLASVPLTAFADAGFLQFKQSFGNGYYAAYDATPVRHRLTINADGQTGKFCLIGSGSCGRLFEIEFDQGPDVQGKWEINGSRGTFQWNFENDRKFQGGFRFNQNMKPSEETDSLYTPYDGNWDGVFAN